MSDNDQYDGQQFQTLFSGDEDDVDSDSVLELARVGPLTFHLKCPPDIGTLFAHKVWSGSIYMSEFLTIQSELRWQSPGSELVTLIGKDIIELGAGTGLPSLTASALGCAKCVITDYPNDEVLNALKETVEHNRRLLLQERSKLLENIQIYHSNVKADPLIQVIGHCWGNDISDLIESDRGREIDEGADMRGTQALFDVALLSECIWLHREHESLAKSVAALLKPGGIAIFTYAHHIPGKEDDDDFYFTICKEKYGLSVVYSEQKSMPYMWDTQKSITIFLKALRKPNTL